MAPAKKATAKKATASNRKTSSTTGVTKSKVTKTTAEPARKNSGAKSTAAKSTAPKAIATKSKAAKPQATEKAPTTKSTTTKSTAARAKATKGAEVTAKAKKPSAAKAKPIPQHVNLATTYHTEHGEDNRLLGLLPYLGMGFTLSETSSGEPGEFLCGIFALMKSYNAFSRALNIKPGSGAESSTVVTDITQWKKWFGSQVYKQEVGNLLWARHEHASEEFKEAEMKQLMKKKFLSDEQLLCLLETANKARKTNFQLGIIHEGWRGKYDVEKGGIDYSYVRESELSLVRKSLQNGPILWIHLEDRDGSRMAKASPEQLEESEPFRNHWQGMEIAKGNSSYIQNCRKWIAQLAVGKRVRDDIKDGVWILTKDYISDTDHELNAYAGAFVRKVKDDTKVSKGYTRVQLCNGDLGNVKDEDLQKIPLARSAPSATSDDLWQLKGDQAIEPHPKEAAASQLPEPESIIESELRFFRVIQSLARNGTLLQDEAQDPIQRPINRFALEDGDIVLDAHDRANHLGTKVARVIGTDGAPGWTWLRRLQQIEYPFGLSDSFPTCPEANTKSAGSKLEIESVAMQGGRRGLRRPKELEERGEEVALKLWRLEQDLTAEETGGTRSLEKGELLLQDPTLRSTGSNRRRHPIRDLEGAPAEVEEKYLLLVHARAWGLRIPQSAANAATLFYKNSDKELGELIKVEETRAPYVPSSDGEWEGREGNERLPWEKSPTKSRKRSFENVAIETVPSPKKRRSAEV